MGSIINISIGIKEPTQRHHNFNTNQNLMFGGYVKVRESLYTRVIIWVNMSMTIFVLVQFYPSMKVQAWCIYLNGTGKKMLSNTCTLLLSKNATSSLKILEGYLIRTILVQY